MSDPSRARVACVARFAVALPLLLGCTRELRVHVSADEVRRFDARPAPRSGDLREAAVVQTATETIDAKVDAVETDGGDRIRHVPPAPLSLALRDLSGGATLVLRQEDRTAITRTGLVLAAAGGGLAVLAGATALFTGFPVLMSPTNLDMHTAWRAEGTFALVGLGVMGIGALIAIAGHVAFLSDHAPRGSGRVVRVGARGLGFAW